MKFHQALFFFVYFDLQLYSTVTNTIELLRFMLYPIFFSF